MSEKEKQEERSVWDTIGYLAGGIAAGAAIFLTFPKVSSWFSAAVSKQSAKIRNARRDKAERGTEIDEKYPDEFDEA